MKNTKVNIRTDANVAIAVVLVFVPKVMDPGIFHAEPQTDRG